MAVVPVMTMPAAMMPMVVPVVVMMPTHLGRHLYAVLHGGCRSGIAQRKRGGTFDRRTQQKHRAERGKPDDLSPVHSHFFTRCRAGNARPSHAPARCNLKLARVEPGLNTFAAMMNDEQIFGTAILLARAV